MIKMFGLAAAAATLVASVPAAAITTFASFVPLSAAANINFTGSTGSVTSTPGAPVTFRFLDASGTTSVFDTAALFNVATTVQGGQIFGSTAIGSTSAGTISFVAAAPVTYLGHTGTNLLTATFMGGTFAGTVGGSVASFLASQPPSGVTFTSDFLSFAQTTARDISVAIDAINPSITAGANGIGDFAGTASGNFGADLSSGSPSAVPEPASWALMVAGFGLVGAMTRRRTAGTVAA